MPNKLSESRSPYLQQHADNPVDWYEWNDAALAKARDENKPILLSVGYSACHWCHVMAHESFEDEQTAALMNESFINIKVDREERPDIDKIYQTSQSLLTQRTGGWPLTMFLDPQTHAPFFGGTYFPKEQRSGLPSFVEVLTGVRDYFNQHIDEVREQGEAVKRALGEIYAANRRPSQLSPNILDQAYQNLNQQYDKQYGGFGEAPKFPHPSYLDFLLYYWEHGIQIEATDTALKMTLETLGRMTCGGIYDQLGGGFYRYSVDKYWLIPHFEKMLYDNGSLLSLLADAYNVTQTEWFAEKARETADWTMREMQSSAGAYYSSLDADSEGGEGMFYVWDKQEIQSLLSGDSLLLFNHCYGLDSPANFEGRWHLYKSANPSELARQRGWDKQTTVRLLTDARDTLYIHRQNRPPPGRDDKVLTAWNALMIKGMAKTAIALDDQDGQRYGDSATQAFDFIRNTLCTDNVLYACWNQTIAENSVFLDDYAFLMDAAFYLLQYQWSSDVLRFTLHLGDQLIERFEDADHGGYFFTPSQQTDLLERPRLFYDEALPSGYGCATSALIRFGFLCGKENYLQSAERALEQASTTLTRSPEACATLLQAFANHRTPPTMIILRGDGDELKRWHKTVTARGGLNQFCFAIPSDADDLPEAFADKHALGDTPCAYICEGSQCQLPIQDYDEFVAYLKQTRKLLPPGTF